VNSASKTTKAISLEVSAAAILFTKEWETAARNVAHSITCLVTDPVPSSAKGIYFR